jgi:hypothetical protein
MFPVTAHGDGRLRARLRFEGALADSCAIQAIAVPLRETAAGAGAQNSNDHVVRLKEKVMPQIRKRGSTLLQSPVSSQAVD